MRPNSCGRFGAFVARPADQSRQKYSRRGAPSLTPLGHQCAAVNVHWHVATFYVSRSSTWMFRRPRVLLGVALCRVKSCSALRIALGARALHEHRVPSLFTNGFVPSLVVEVWTLALSIVIWRGACRLCGRHIGADVSASAVCKSVMLVLCCGTGARWRHLCDGGRGAPVCPW